METMIYLTIMSTLDLPENADAQAETEAPEKTNEFPEGYPNYQEVNAFVDSVHSLEDLDLTGKVSVEDLTPEEFHALRKLWRAGLVAEEDLPEGAHGVDATGRPLVLGWYKPKIGRDAERGIKRMPEEMAGGVPGRWKPTLAEPIPVLQCTALKKNGERCKRWSIRGASVCISHGGKIPAVQKKAAAMVESARMRLMDLTDDAVDVLEELTRVGTADAIRLKAATEILDRAGVKGGMDVNVEVEHKFDPAAEIADRLKQIADRARGGTQEDVMELEAIVVEEE